MTLRRFCISIAALASATCTENAPMWSTHFVIKVESVPCVWTALLFIATLLSPSLANAECTADDIGRMEETMAAEDIERICAGGNAPGQQEDPENVGAASGDLADCRRRLDVVVGEHYDLMNSVDKRFLSGRELEIYEQEERTIWGSSDTVYDLRECEEAIGQYESVNRQLESAGSRQQQGEDRYGECLSKLEALRDEMAEHDISSPDGHPESLELCEQEYAYEKGMYRTDLMNKRRHEAYGR